MMNVSSFVFEQVLKQLKIPSQAIHQLQIAGQLSDVDGNGFPTELFQLSAPMITRGLLNYALLQMKRDWVYPHWVHRQLDPKNESFIARSQNPLLLNTTHRNWTLLGSLTGKHEAIIDPRGLATPLPREWSLDVWLKTENELFLPSFHFPSSQEFDTHAPRVITRFVIEDFILDMEAFVDSTNRGRDVLFQRINVINCGKLSGNLAVCVAVRPFNPEGVSPIHRIEYRPSKQIIIDQCLGVVFAEEPRAVFCSNSEKGDVVNLLRQQNFQRLYEENGNILEKKSISCAIGLAHAVAVFPLKLLPGERHSIHYSTALGPKEELRLLRPRAAWRVSFENRLERQQTHWVKERSLGAQIILTDESMQKVFDANVLTLLQLHDGKSISPGPYLYHHFWFRDAAPMLYALDRLGFHKRVRQVIDAFPERQRSDGFFRGPDGEWDSNGEALWIVDQHVKLTHSYSWLKHYFPSIQRAAEWILQKKRTSKDTPITHRGLLPPSLSAEHFGTVDQYYWDSFWGLAGIRSAFKLAHVLHKEELADRWEHEAETFAGDIYRSLEKVALRLGREVIPASPSRSFDESAIGFVCGIYPLALDDVYQSAFQMTLDEFTDRYVDEKGFYHPIIHSGYNPYLTLQLAHAYLLRNNPQRAWHIANTIFRQCVSPYSLPEAIHPKTGGGVMGDGHHGWAAAEIVLFLLDCLVRENKDTLMLFHGVSPGMLKWGTNTSIHGIATSFGKFHCSLQYETERKALCSLTLEQSSDKKPYVVDIHLPFTLKRVLAVTLGVELQVVTEETETHIKCSSGNAVLLLEQ
jgi:hypothetical protein